MGGSPQVPALRRIAGVDDGQQAAVVAESPSPEAEPNLPTRYQRMWENGASRAPRGRPAAEPEPPPSSAQWDPHLCNELVSYMNDAGRRLVVVLAASGADGVTRGSLTAQLGIAVYAIRTTQVSIGHALRRMQRDSGNVSLPRLVEFHRAINTYMLHPDFRAWIQGRA